MSNGLIVSQRPGTGRRRGSAGFTLIELLIVVVIIGILVLVSLPRFAGARKKAYRAQMQSDLRTLVSAQESYFNVHLAYADNVSLLDINRTPNVTLSIEEVAANGWSAKATHASSTEECGIFIGNASPPSGIPVTDDGLVTCTN
jgi:prepilin-type N-terminal cleavage/methylation domain-containing protein